ncbi:hypothetical protein TREMEDRAFT_61497 [Tremella mesenterica DSM 1558]|uniref:uncharacterized protein n=1 Tax=Tremella mesenterica (strain ATCC 24925 / CBS 8224 / DSM 1558 / NBRC 9311 / NRRL Y-6157 / RJB 2259-6 / UBC 559-6) TaxID=578456 RepID=UPI0003F490BA|nr:uncharacterized protein TREMEDRAFT_61497 [Tremella mesenterica DSM 1558]EIW69734.1 hypothetical protein TREMEDRAFT_61497 [Tremella mesenterica DSM 1558]
MSDRGRDRDRDRRADPRDWDEWHSNRRRDSYMDTDRRNDKYDDSPRKYDKHHPYDKYHPDDKHPEDNRRFDKYSNLPLDSYRPSGRGRDERLDERVRGDRSLGNVRRPKSPSIPPPPIPTSPPPSSSGAMGGSGGGGDSGSGLVGMTVKEEDPELLEGPQSYGVEDRGKGRILGRGRERSVERGQYSGREEKRRRGNSSNSEKRPRKKDDVREDGERRDNSSDSTSDEEGQLKRETSAASLKEFILAIRASISTSSSLDLAIQHLQRLSSFRLSSPELLDAARFRIRDLESELKTKLFVAQRTFGRLMRHSLSIPGVKEGDMTGLDLDWVKDRLDGMEEKVREVSDQVVGGVRDSRMIREDVQMSWDGSGGVRGASGDFSGEVQPTSGPSRPIQQFPSTGPTGPAGFSGPVARSGRLGSFDQRRSSDPSRQTIPEGEAQDLAETAEDVDMISDDTRQAKRSRARRMLENMLERLEAIEMRSEEIENQLYCFEGNQRDPGIKSWKELLDLRDPDGRLRGARGGDSVRVRRRIGDDALGALGYEKAGEVGGVHVRGTRRGKGMMKGRSLGGNDLAEGKNESEGMEVEVGEEIEGKDNVFGKKHGQEDQLEMEIVEIASSEEGEIADDVLLGMEEEEKYRDEDIGRVISVVGKLRRRVAKLEREVRDLRGSQTSQVSTGQTGIAEDGQSGVAEGGKEGGTVGKGEGGGGETKAELGSDVLERLKLELREEMVGVAKRELHKMAITYRLSAQQQHQQQQQVHSRTPSNPNPPNVNPTIGTHVDSQLRRSSDPTTILPPNRTSINPQNTFSPLNNFQVVSNSPLNTMQTLSNSPIINTNTVSQHHPPSQLHPQPQALLQSLSQASTQMQSQNQNQRSNSIGQGPSIQTFAAQMNQIHGVSNSSGQSSNYVQNQTVNLNQVQNQQLFNNKPLTGVSTSHIPFQRTTSLPSSPLSNTPRPPLQPSFPTSQSFSGTNSQSIPQIHSNSYSNSHPNPNVNSNPTINPNLIHQINQIPKTGSIPGFIPIEQFAIEVYPHYLSSAQQNGHDPVQLVKSQDALNFAYREHFRSTMEKATLHLDNQQKGLIQQQQQQQRENGMVSQLSPVGQHHNIQHQHVQMTHVSPVQQQQMIQSQRPQMTHVSPIQQQQMVHSQRQQYTQQSNHMSIPQNQIRTLAQSADQRQIEQYNQIIRQQQQQQFLADQHQSQQQVNQNNQSVHGQNVNYPNQSIQNNNGQNQMGRDDSPILPITSTQEIISLGPTTSMNSQSSGGNTGNDVIEGQGGKEKEVKVEHV